MTNSLEKAIICSNCLWEKAGNSEKVNGAVGGARRQRWRRTASVPAVSLRGPGEGGTLQVFLIPNN